MLDYKIDRSMVGEWVDPDSLVEMPIEECPDLMGISVEDWLTRVRPKLKEGHDYWKDYNKNMPKKWKKEIETWK